MINECDEQANQQLKALGDSKARLMRQRAERWIRVKTVYNEKTCCVEKRPTRKQQEALEKIAREISKIDAAQQALFKTR